MAQNRSRNLLWECVPSEFLYLRQAVDRYGESGLVIPYDEVMGRHVRFAERATPEQLAELASACEGLSRRGGDARLIEWIDAREGGRPSETRVASAIRGLLMTFQTLAELGREPFASARRAAYKPELQRVMDPSKMPETLRPFVAVFEKWGDVRSDTLRHELIDRAVSHPSEMTELKNFHAHLSRVELATYEGWLNPKGAWSHEQAKVNFTLLLMYGELAIENR